jgi:hypothetical protein
VTRRISWAEASARRLARNGLSAPLPDAGPADAVATMCGAHAQVLSAAELSIGLRLTAGTRRDVRDALWTERSLVKAYGPRGTVHLLATRDLPMWTGALAAVPRAPSPFPEDARLTREQTEGVIAAIRAALADAELTIDELGDAVVAATGSWAGDRVMPAFQEMWPRWRQAVSPAALRGALCFGPNRGRHVTYTSPHRWSPGFRPAEPGAALADLVGRYLHAYGPATPEHFARWLAAPKPWARELFGSLALHRVDFDGTEAWLPQDEESPAATPEGLRLLPYFDAYTIACQPREKLFPGRAAERALAGGQAGNFPVLMIDGTVAGVWHQRRSGRRIAVTVEPFRALSKARRRELDEQVSRVGEILEGEPTLTIGTVTVGGHA